MPIDCPNNGEPTEDDIYFAKLTMDEVGADIEEHGHVAVTPENATQDPFTAKGSLANALDEAISTQSENVPEEKDPSPELNGEIEGIEMGNKPDTPTMDGDNSKSAKDSLADALDSVAMDAKHTDEIESIKEKVVRENEIGDADTQMDNADRKWLQQRDETLKPELPKSLGGTPKAEDDGLVYLEYTFTVDPTTYRSNNYQPIANAADGQSTKTGESKFFNKRELEERANNAENPKESEQIEVAEVGEKETEDEAPEKVALDYATCYDGSSFLCYDEVDGIDYTKIAMDASPKTPNMKPNCKTTFAQCRAKNPLYCRFHGPKLLEKDIKQALTALLGKNSCTISVTKDKGAKNPMTFRLTIGCVPSMKEKVEDMVHKFMTQNPGIKSTEDWKDLGGKGGKIMETEEFEIDILQADKPPKASDWALQAKYDTDKAKAAGTKQAVVGETPSNIEAIANGEKPPMKDKSKKTKPVESQEENEAQNVNAEEVLSSMGGIGDDKGNSSAADYTKQYADLADKAAENNLFDNPDFKAKYDAIYHSGDEMEKQVEQLSALVDEFMGKKEVDTNSENADAITQEQKEEIGKNIDNGKNETYVGTLNMIYNAIDQGAGKEKVKELANKLYSESLDPDNPQVMEATADAIETISDILDLGEVEFDGVYVNFLKEGGNKSGSEREAETKESGLGKVFSNAESSMKDIMDEGVDFLMAGYENVDEAEKALKTAFKELKNTKGSIEALEKTIKQLDEEGDMSVSAIAKKKSLKAGLKKFSDQWPQALSNFEKAQEEMKNAIKEAQALDVDKMKAESAASVEGIVRSIAKFMFPNGKTEGVESVAELIDFKESQLNKFASENGMSDEDLHGVKEKHEVFDTYRSAANACHEFDIAVQQFKDVIDEVKGTEGKEALDSAKNEISTKGVELESAFGAYNQALENAKTEIELWKKMQDLDSSAKDSGGDEQPSAEELEKCGKAISDHLGHDKESSEWPAYYQKELSDILTGNNFPENIDKKDGLKHGGSSRRDFAKMFLGYIKDVEGFDSVKSALQKIVDMPTKGKKANSPEQPKEESPQSISEEDLKKFAQQKFEWSWYAWFGVLQDILDKNKKVKIGESDVKVLNKALAKAGDKDKIAQQIFKAAKEKGIELEPLEGNHMNEKKSGMPARQKKTYTKEMLASMSPKEKLTAAISIAKKKLAANPSDEGLKAKLAKWEKQLASLSE